MKIGDKVEILNKYRYYTNHDGIPNKYIIHGTLKINENYTSHIVAIYGNFFIIRFKCSEKKIVQLGYKKNSLKVIESISPFYKIY